MSGKPPQSKHLLRRLAKAVARPFRKNGTGDVELRKRIDKLTADRDGLRAKAATYRAQRDKLKSQLHQMTTQVGLVTASRNMLSAYGTWIVQYDTLGPDDHHGIRAHISQFARKPLISVIMPVWNTPEHCLRRAIETVRNQLYENWELCIADDHSTKPHVRQVLEEFSSMDPRIKVVFREKGGHISAASNSALELATGEYVAFLDHDDELREHALYMVVQEILEHPEADLIYSDEDKIDEAGNRFDPYFKSDFNYDLLTAQNCICHLGVYRTSLVQKLGGFTLGTEGAQDWDLAFRVVEHSSPERIRHIPHILYHWRLIPGSTASGPEEKPYALEAGRKVVLDHLERYEGVRHECEILPIHMMRVIRAVPESAPSVTLIVPTRNLAALLTKCIDTLTALTDYPNFEVLILDNDSTEPDALEYLEKLKKRPSVRVLKVPGPFNYSRLNNLGVNACNSQIVGLLNNDLEIQHPGWLREMVSHAMRPGIGAVGAKLFYPNGALQHVGVFLGVRGVAGHYYKGCPGDYLGSGARNHVLQNVTAVTGACLLVAREKYLQVGGLDEERLPVAFNDVDFCLKLHEAGYRNLITPFARLLHHESASRGYTLDTPEDLKRGRAEIQYFTKRWAGLIEHDPAYNPNLTIDFETGSFAYPTRARKPWRSSPSLVDPRKVGGGGSAQGSAAAVTGAANGAPQAPFAWSLNSPSADHFATPDPSSCLVEGWVVSRLSLPVSLIIRVENGPSMRCEAEIERPDVVAALGDNYPSRLKCGFSIKVPLGVQHAEEVVLRLAFTDGRVTLPELVYHVKRPTAPFATTPDAFYNLHYNRAVVGAQFLSGSGVEYGGLTTPQGLPPGVKIQRLDQATTEELRAKYGKDPMLTARSFVEVDALANVVTFDTLADESQDFAIIHDVIEHLDNPLLALKNWLRVLKPEGILLISAPDKRFTFDYQREITPFAHLERDFMEGPEWSRLDAYREWYRFVDEAPDVEKAAVEGSEKNDDIHFHSWTHCEIMEMLIESKRRLGLQFEFKLILENEGELLIAMKKTQVQVYDRAAGATTAAP